MTMLANRTCRALSSAGLLAMLLAGPAAGQTRVNDSARVPPQPRRLLPDARPVRSCESLATATLPNTTIESAVMDPDGADVCRVTAFTTHPPAGDRVRIWIAIPTADWNGRFLGTGGGGFTGGRPGALTEPVALGYAAGATDTGHEGGSGSFALDADGRIAWQLIRDNAHVGIHEMTETGKALTRALYGQAPRYSYFSGCSTGGRQALMEAQRYPGDYDGIVAGAPAINWHKLHVQQLWGPMLMNVADHPIPSCKLALATSAAIAACDPIDGVADGVIEDPMRCDYDPSPLIGASAGECGTLTATDVDFIRRIWEGPHREGGGFLWYGMPWGADLSRLSGSAGDPIRPQAHPIPLDWLRYFLAQDPDFDWTTVTRAAYERFWDQSVEQYGTVIGTDDPDLAAFRDRGGKAIVWHGWDDPLITARGTIDYYERVRAEMGGAERAEEFIRLFMAPGVGHCRGGAGPEPSGQLEAVLAWVEEGRAPEMLMATRRNADGGVLRTRPLCMYPRVARYTGTGSTDVAASFVCSDVSP